KKDRNKILSFLFVSINFLNYHPINKMSHLYYMDIGGHMRKLTYSFVVLLLVFSALPLNVFAAENQETDVNRLTEEAETENDSEAKEQELQDDESNQEQKEQEEAQDQSDKEATTEKSKKTDQDKSSKKEQSHSTSKEEKQDVTKETKETSEPKRNENGIVEGTKVYGIDISEFSEEELQYIPKGWRDGVTLENSEHPHGTDEF